MKLPEIDIRGMTAAGNKPETRRHFKNECIRAVTSGKDGSG